MLRFKKYSMGSSLLTCGFGEGADTAIGALSKPATKATKPKGENGASFSRSDFLNWHAESGTPKFNKKSKYGGYSFYSKYEGK